MFFSKKRKLLNKAEIERVIIKEKYEKTELLKRFLGEINEIIFFSLIKKFSRKELMDFSLLHFDKNLWGGFFH